MCEKTLTSFLQPSGCLILLSDVLFLMLQKPSPSRMVHLIPKQTSRVLRVSISEDHPWVTHPWTKQRRIPDPYKINSIETYTTHHSGGSCNNWLEIDGKTFAKPCIAGEYERVSKGFTMFHHHPAFLGCIPLESCFFLKHHCTVEKQKSSTSTSKARNAEDAKEDAKPGNQDIFLETN